MREHQLAADQVEEIVLGVDPLTRVHAGSVGPEPRDLVEAQFSAEFNIALSFVRGGNGLSEYADVERQAFRDPEVVALARRVRLVADEECAAEWPDAWLGKVTVRVRDGRRLSEQAYGRGTPQNPMALEEIVRKFRGLVTTRFPGSRADAIVSAVMEMEQLRSARELADLLSMTSSSAVSTRRSTNG